MRASSQWYGCVPGTGGWAAPLCLAALAAACERAPQSVAAVEEESRGGRPTFGLQYVAPAGERQAARHIDVHGIDAAILPNGRLLLPSGREIAIDAPKPYGMALSPDGRTLATINSGAVHFSLSLIGPLDQPSPPVRRVDVDATFMGVTFSGDGTRFFASGGENGNLWIGDVASATIIGSVNLNGPDHPLNRPLDPRQPPTPRFKGAFPGNLVLDHRGRYLYVVDQAGFEVHVVDVAAVVTGVDAQGLLVEPDNFAAVVGRVPAGRYPYALALSPDGKRLFVANVGVFEYSSLLPDAPTGDSNLDFPLCYPALTYPDDMEEDLTLAVKPVDPRDLPPTLREEGAIRCGYVAEELSVTVPGLGSPNAPESSSVWIYDLAHPTAPALDRVVRTGLAVGEKEDGVAAYGASHPNAIAAGHDAIYVANGNNDSVSVLSPRTQREIERIDLTLLSHGGRRLKGTQPVALALSPDESTLYVAEAGINAIGVVRVGHFGPRVIGHVPVGWWPSAIAVSRDGRKIAVANARGRGAGPNDDVPPDNLGSPKASVLGSVSILDRPSPFSLFFDTARVIVANGFIPRVVRAERGDPIPADHGTPSRHIRHVVFINKENATHDSVLGHVLETRRGEPVDGEPRYSMGQDAMPNHHELALSFGFSDNFYLEPSVSSDGHRWLTDTYTTEFEETHWPASYGGRRNDAGTDRAVFERYPGRLGFTDANASPEPHDYNQHGGIYLHLARKGLDFVNFGNGFEFAVIDEDFGTEPTGVREKVNVPMETVVRDHSDHLFPSYNTHIPDSPLPEDPTRFSRFGRFAQVFEAEYVDRRRDKCRLPQYVDLYYPNDHGGGARDINPEGPDWSYKRFLQDNDAALGKTVELISHSPCWKDTAIFVVEDDTQNGLDHVDGHRSLLLVISPWAKREHVSHVHASLSSVFKTAELILGLPPLNQYDAAATDLRDLFTAHPDYTPYTAVPVDFDTPNAIWSARSRELDFSAPDADEARLRAAILESESLPRAPASASAKRAGR